MVLWIGNLPVSPYVVVVGSRCNLETLTRREWRRSAVQVSGLSTAVTPAGVRIRRPPVTNILALPWTCKLLMLAIMAVVLSCAHALATEQGKPSDVGVVFMKDGRVVQVTNFAGLEERRIMWEEDGNELKLVLGEATRIRVLDPHWLEITLRDGRVIRAEDPVMQSPKGSYFSFMTGSYWFSILRSFYNHIDNRWSTQEEEFHWSEIDRMEFTATPGVKKCPQCSKMFPGEYYFCPYDATPLVWRDAEEDQGYVIPEASGVSWRERNGLVEVFRYGTKLGEYPRQVRLSGVSQEDRATVACEAVTTLIDLLAPMVGLPGTGASLPICNVICEDSDGVETSSFYLSLSTKDQVFYGLQASGLWGRIIADGLTGLGFHPDTELPESGLVYTF
jgi:hypothetical protein